MDFVEFTKYAKKHMSYDRDVIQGEICKILFNTPFSTKTNCGQFTALILMKINLLDFSHFRNRSKHHLMWTANLTKVKKNFYRDPKYIYQQYFKVIDIE